MKRLLPAVALAVALAACVSASTRVEIPVTPAPTASPTPSPKASPIVSAKGFITVSSPTTNAKLQSPVIISGDASVFEAALQWRITDQGGRVIAEGLTTPSQGAPGRGTYSVSGPYPVTTETVAFVEGFSGGAKDGNIDHPVRGPVAPR